MSFTDPVKRPLNPRFTYFFSQNEAPAEQVLASSTPPELRGGKTSVTRSLIFIKAVFFRREQALKTEAARERSFEL